MYILHFVGVSFGDEDPWKDLSSGWKSTANKQESTNRDEQEGYGYTPQSLSSTRGQDGVVDNATAMQNGVVTAAAENSNISCTVHPVLQELDLTHRSESRMFAGTLCALKTYKPLSQSALSKGRQEIKFLREKIRKLESIKADTANLMGTREELQAADIGIPEEDAVVSAPSSAISDMGAETRRHADQGSSLQSETASDVPQSRNLSADSYPSSKRARSNEDEFNSHYQESGGRNSNSMRYENDSSFMGSEYLSDDAVDSILQSSSSHQGYQVDQGVASLPDKQTPWKPRTLEESDLVGMGFVRSNPRGDVRTSMLQAPVLERLVDSEWIKFSKAFQAYRTQGGDRSLYNCLSSAVFDSIISYLNHHGYVKGLTLINLEQHIDEHEFNMFVHLQKICGIVNPTKSKTELQKVYEMPYDHPADFWAKNQQPLWSALIHEDAIKERLSHEWTATTMLEGLKRNYPDLRNDLYRRLVAPYTTPGARLAPNWIEISRSIEGAIHAEFQTYQMAKEVAKLRLKRDIAIMCKVREHNAPRLSWIDGQDKLKSTSVKPTRDGEALAHHSSGHRLTHTPRVNAHVTSNRPVAQPKQNTQHSHYQPQTYPSHNTEMENGKDAFNAGKRIPPNASKVFKKAYYDAKKSSYSSKQ